MEIQRADERTHVRLPWLDSYHSFPFAGNFDLAANAHGVLLVLNEDFVAPGEGFDTHHHKDAEIVTWVMRGTVVHADSAGNTHRIPAGSVQRMTAGTGISHSERCESGGEPAHVVQMWAATEKAGLPPDYRQADFTDKLRNSGLVTIASGLDKHADDPGVGINNSFAALSAARLSPGQSIQVPAAPYVHVFVAGGRVRIDYETVEHGDAVKLADGRPRTLRATEPSEVLIWEMHTRI